MPVITWPKIIPIHADNLTPMQIIFLVLFISIIVGIILICRLRCSRFRQQRRLNKNDEINLDFTKIEHGKFFYDLIYNPKETNFLKMGKKLGHRTENGKMMFIYQALYAFKVWHGVEPGVNEDVIKILD